MLYGRFVVLGDVEIESFVIWQAFYCNLGFGRVWNCQLIGNFFGG